MTEALLRKKAQAEGQDLDALVDALILDAIKANTQAVNVPSGTASFGRGPTP